METDWGKKEAMTREEAIKELRGFIGQLTEGCQEVIKVLIPELAESEDERIRKRLIEYFEGFMLGKANVFWEGLRVEDILAWLENQKENPDRLILIGKAKSEKQVVLLAESNGDENIYWDTKSEDDAVSLLEKGLKFFGKQKPATIEQVYEKFVKPEVIKEVRTNKYIRAQLLWELMHNGIITEVDYNYLTDDSRKPWSKEEYRKAYKDGFEVSEQLKTERAEALEWSEEDEKIRRNLMSLLANVRGDRITETAYQKYYPWLKSLRPQPKRDCKDCAMFLNGKCTRPRWKPSEEQMDSLLVAIHYTPSDENTLISLYNDLKKLEE